MSKVQVSPASINTSRLGSLQNVMDGKDLTFEENIGEFAFFLKDRRCWIIEDSKLVQGSKVYSMFLPGDIFSIVLVPGSNKVRIVIEYRKNDQVLYRSQEKHSSDWNPQGFFAVLAGGAGVSIGQCAWLKGSKHTISTDQIDWRDKENVEVQIQADKTTLICRGKKVKEERHCRSHVMTGTAEIIADVRSNDEILGLQFKIEEGNYGEKSWILTGMVPSTANVNVLCFPKFAGSLDTTSSGLKKEESGGGCCTIT